LCGRGGGTSSHLQNPERGKKQTTKEGGHTARASKKKKRKNK